MKLSYYSKYIADIQVNIVLIMENILWVAIAKIEIKEVTGKDSNPQIIKYAEVCGMDYLPMKPFGAAFYESGSLKSRY